MVRISFETDTASFGPSGVGRQEIARILHSLANKVLRGGYVAQGPLFDINGNRVGTYDLNAPIIKAV